MTAEYSPGDDGFGTYNMDYWTNLDNGNPWGWGSYDWDSMDPQKPDKYNPQKSNSFADWLRWVSQQVRERVQQQIPTSYSGVRG